MEAAHSHHSDIDISLQIQYNIHQYASEDIMPYTNGWRGAHEFDPRPVLIYFLQTQQYVKIGKTEPERLLLRMVDFRVSNPFPITLIRLIAGPEDLEKWFHLELQKYWFSGEWYRYNDKIMVLMPPHPDLWEECDPRNLLGAPRNKPWIHFSRNSPFAPIVKDSEEDFKC